MAHGQRKRVLSQARMAAYTSDSPTVFALQHGFCQAWLQTLGLKKDMSLVSDDTSQPIKLDNGSTLPPCTWPSDNVFSDDANFGYPTCDLSFVVEGMWAEFPYLRRMKDFSYPLKYKCKAGTSNIKPKFGMYYGVPAHEKCGLPVSTKSAMNHMCAHYWIVLVCPFCGMHGLHSYSSIREHVKKCKETYRDLLEGSDAETGLYKPCFCKGDMYLPKKGLAPPMSFTYKLEEGRVNTKTIKQLISKFHTRAKEDVTAVCKACLLCKRQNVQAPDDDSKKSSYAAETDAKKTPKKKWIKSTPSTTKSPPSAAVGRAPKGTGIDEIKGLDDDELDYNNYVGSEGAGGDPVQVLEPHQDEKLQDSRKSSDEQCHPSGDGSTIHPGGSHSDCKKSRGGSESRSPRGSCSPPPPCNRVCSGDRVHDGDRSRDKDHRSDQGSYYPDDHSR